jgi:hypothetical protein
VTAGVDAGAAKVERGDGPAKDRRPAHPEKGREGTAIGGQSRNRGLSITFLILCCPTHALTLVSRSMSVASTW